MLRALEEQAVRRVGDQKLRQIKDLYYRLKGMEFYLLPLRERREDIPPLGSHFLHRWAQREGRTLPGITQWAMAVLMDYDWPGNVRERMQQLGVK